MNIIKELNILLEEFKFEPRKLQGREDKLLEKINKFKESFNEENVKKLESKFKSLKIKLNFEDKKHYFNIWVNYKGFTLHINLSTNVKHLGFLSWEITKTKREGDHSVLMYDSMFTEFAFTASNIKELEEFILSVFKSDYFKSLVRHSRNSRLRKRII